MQSRYLLRSLTVATAVAGLVLLSVSLAAADDPPTKPSTTADPPTASLTIGANTPLRVIAQDTGRFQLRSDGTGQFFPPAGDNASNGPVLKTGGTVRCSVFGTSFTPVSQAVTGSTVTTVLSCAGAAGMRLTQTLQLPSATSNSVSVTYLVENTGVTAVTADVMQVADMSLDGVDNGFGYYNPLDGATGSRNATNTRFLAFVPATNAGTLNYFAGSLGTLGGMIPTGLTNTCQCSTSQDASAGLEWRAISLAPGASALIAFSVFTSTSAPGPTPTPTATMTPTPTPTATLTPTPPPATPTPLPTAAPLPTVVAPPTCVGNVRGRVVTTAGGPVTGRTVRLFEPDGKFKTGELTNSGGDFNFTGLGQGEWTIEVVLEPGERTTTERIRVVVAFCDHNVTDQIFRLQR